MASTGKSEQTVIWRAQPKQALFIACPCDDVAFGGARGGGKSDAIVGDAIAHESRYGKDAAMLVLRRERTQLVELMTRAQQICTPLGFVWKESDKLLIGPKGGRLRFGYCERDGDAEAYQGWSLTRLFVDECATFPSESPINKLQATLRSGAGVPCQMKVTCNPGGTGHGWTKARYRLDEYPGGFDVFTFEWTHPVTKKKVERTRTFISSKVVDNQYLPDSYVASLYQVGSDELVRAWLDGDWSVTEGAFFDCWTPSKHVIRPFHIPREWMKFRSIDWGSRAPFSVGFWAVVSDTYHHDDGHVLPRGSLVRFREWYGASSPGIGLKLTAEEVAAGILERSMENEYYEYSIIDPSTYARAVARPWQSVFTMPALMFARATIVASLRREAWAAGT